MPTEKRDIARAAALQLLHAIETESSSLAPSLARLDAGELGNMDSRDRRFVRQLLLGCLRWQKRLDWIAGQFSRRPVADLSPWARLLLRLGIYQLFWLDRVPERAAVHTSVDLAKQFAHRGIANLVNAVLRRIQRQREQIRYPCRDRDLVAYLAIYHSHPEWLVERWLSNWGERPTEELLRANNLQAPLYVRLNLLRGERDDLLAAFAAEELKLQQAGPLSDCFEVVEGEGLFQSAAYATGLFQVQDVNAGLPVALLDPRPEDRVLDICSGPGGKSTQMAVAMRDRGLLVAADVAPARLHLVRENAHRLGLQNLKHVVQDGRRPASRAASFTHVLADVPCSATGTLGRHPDGRWHKKASQLTGLVARQKDILARGFAQLQPGGLLVYSSCSLESEENAGVVDSFLECTAAAELEPASLFFPDEIWADRYIQTLPGRDPGDGSFAARIRKKAP